MTGNVPESPLDLSFTIDSPWGPALGRCAMHNMHNFRKDFVS